MLLEKIFLKYKGERRREKGERRRENLIITSVFI
jgi:hypothetical protein